MDNNLSVIGTLSGNKHTIAENLIHSFQEAYPSVQGEVYLGYPIYINEVTNDRICVDIALISRVGVYIINILENPVTDYGTIQDTIYAKVEMKFKKQSFLYKKRKLLFDFQIITYCSATMQEMEDYPLANNNSQLMAFINNNKLEEELSEDLYKKILSGIQEAYGINNHLLRDDVNEGTKAFSINQMSRLIEVYGNSQMEAILSDTEGIQRIRGMAGSGKTIVLARKAVELHTAHPDWDIVITYSTRSLKKQIENLVERFYALKNDGAKYNKKKLKIMHSWGSAYSTGVYYEVCLMHGISPLNFNEAKAKYGRHAKHFSRMCGDLLKEIKRYNKLYDCILIDEAQDFDINFLQLCSRIIGPNQRLVYAYDELQSLSEDLMPNPEKIFGRSIQNDTPLVVCYRNQGPVIVTAHAIGMGLYRKEGLVQLPGSADVWTAIGYCSDNPIQQGKEAVLYRTKETSPDYLNISPDEIIKFSKYENNEEMNKALIKIVYEDLTQEQLSNQDIMIIDMDTLSYANNCNELIKLIKTINIEKEKNNESFYDVAIHTAGAASPEDFFREKSIVYSSVRRAKGNESYMVYIVNAQKCVNSLQPRADRNALFTAITRSKGWVRVFGYGEDMEDLCNEFNTIKEHDFKLYFEHYPTKEELESIFLNNQDVQDKDVKAFAQTQELINRLSSEGSMSKVQLMKKLFNANTDEMIKWLQEQDNE